MDACNSEKLSDLSIEPPDDIKRNIPDWVFPTQQIIPTSSKPSRWHVNMPIEESGRYLVLFRLHREMHRALSLLPRRTQQLRETGETGEN